VLLPRLPLVLQVPPDSIRATLCALGPSLELPAALRTLPPAPVGLPGASSNGAVAHNPWPAAPGSTYSLRAVVCYFGHHYLAFALSEVSWCHCVSTTHHVSRSGCTVVNGGDREESAALLRLELHTLPATNICAVLIPNAVITGARHVAVL
jgi:hypothetical protein